MGEEKGTQEKSFLKSKKWWIGIVGVLVPVINSFLPEGTQLELAQVVQVLTPLFAYIVGQGLADFGKTGLMSNRSPKSPSGNPRNSGRPSWALRFQPWPKLRTLSCRMK